MSIYSVSSKMEVLEEKHAIATLMYISEHDGCRKTDLYRDVSRNPRMPEKLDQLESAGLIVQEACGNRSVLLRLTVSGRQVADELYRIGEILGSPN